MCHFVSKHPHPPFDSVSFLKFELWINVCYEFYVLAAEPSEKSVEIMRKFSEQYARKSGTYFCVDKGVTSVVIKVCIYLLFGPYLCTIVYFKFTSKPITL